MASCVMHFYAIGWKEFLALPYYTFWELARNIDRIRADEDSRMLSVICSAFSERIDDYVNALNEQKGRIVITEEISGDDFESTRRELNNLKMLIGR